jgi:hypothetical protein
VAYLDPPAVTAVGTGLHHPAGAGREDRRAGRRCEVDTRLQLGELEDRVAAHRGCSARAGLGASGQTTAKSQAPQPISPAPTA